MAQAKKGGAAPKKGQKTRRREKKNVPHGAAHIKSTFNNTIVSITDPAGQRHRLGVVGPRRLQGFA